MNPAIRDEIEVVNGLGVLAGAVLDDMKVAQVVDAAGQADRFGFWFGGDGVWPFERAIAFANVEAGRVLFVSSDPAACNAASNYGVRVYDKRSGEIATLLP